MQFANPVGPYADCSDTYVTIQERSRILNCSEDRVRELARQGTLRSRWGLVQPALIPGVTG
jgi:hypothetical protein